MNLHEKETVTASRIDIYCIYLPISLPSFAFLLSFLFILLFPSPSSFRFSPSPFSFPFYSPFISFLTFSFPCFLPFFCFPYPSFSPFLFRSFFSLPLPFHFSPIRSFTFSFPLLHSCLQTVSCFNEIIYVYTYRRRSILAILTL